ncbi:MAG: transporter [Vicingaceae bacterium]
MSNYFKILVCASIFLVVSFIPKFCSAQFSETIATGRPGQANGPFGVGKNIYQIQSGLYFDQNSTNLSPNKLEQSSWSHNSVIRLGLKEDFEFRLAYRYQILDRIESGSEKLRSDIAGFRNFSFGFRQFLAEQKGLLPSFGLQFTAISGGSNRYAKQNLDTELKLIAHHRITDKFGLNTNLAFRWQVDQQATTALYVLSFRYTLTDKLRLVAEAYGDIEEDDLSLLFDAGFGYFINDNFQLDCYAAYGQNQEGEFGPTTTSYFVSAGFSYRLNKRP